MTTLPPGPRTAPRAGGVVAQKTKPRYARGFANISAWLATATATAERRFIRSRNWSGKRDSNSRPRPWQGRALPTELFPREPHIIRLAARVSTSGGHFCDGLSAMREDFVF